MTLPRRNHFSHVAFFIVRQKTEKVMNIVSQGLVVSTVAAILTATPVSAAVVCNDEGDCWRVTGEPRYEPSLKLRIMPDDWRWKEGERYRWREPGQGHGYWRGEKWIAIEPRRP